MTCSESAAVPGTIPAMTGPILPTAGGQRRRRGRRGESCQETAISGPRISTADAFSRLFGNTLVLSSLLTLQSGQVGRDLPQYMDFHLGGADSLRGHTVDDLGYDLFNSNNC